MLWDDPGFPFLHTGLLMAADRFIIIKHFCGFDNREKAENASKKQMKSCGGFTKRKIKEKNCTEPCFLKRWQNKRNTEKNVFSPFCCILQAQKAIFSATKKPCTTQTAQGRETIFTSSAAFRRHLRHLPDIRRRRSRSYRHRKAQPAGDRWGTLPARAGRALQPPHPHGSRRTH